MNDNKTLEDMSREAKDAIKEVIDILKELPEERQAYLNGYAAGMNAERRLSADTRSA